MTNLCLRWALPLALVAATGVTSAAPQLVTGEIGGAKFAIARPATWNGNVLLHAHGFRPESAPLVATLDPTDRAWASLLDAGWMVAATSYRRNGLIIRDAISDLDALRNHVEQTEGRPTLVLLLGESMGGTIVTLMAERSPDRYHGAIAIGAALDARDAEKPQTPSGTPRVPVLFLTNQSELAGPEAYVAAAANATVPPALWTIARDGHVNVNAAERAHALEALIAWVTSDRIERQRDATIALLPPRVAEIEGTVASGSVQSVTDDFGNVFLSLTPDDFAHVGIRRGDDFLVATMNREWRVRYGSDYGDVARGEWVAFPRAEGFVLLAINYGNAAATAGVKAGDPFTVRAIR